MKKFKKIYIEITNICNLSCNFCLKTERQPKFMSYDEFGFILDAIKDYTQYIYFHIKGEPLIHPQLGDFLDLAHKKGFKSNITTNGVLIKEKKDNLLNKPGLRQINISLHSLDGNEGYKERDSYLNNIFNLIEEARDVKTLIIALRLWNLELEDNFNRNRNRYILEKLEREFGLTYNIEDEISPKRGIKIRERLYLNEDIRFVWPDLKNSIYSEKGFCHGLRDQIGILVDGTVVPCCLDGEGKIKLGNIFYDSIDKILHSPKARDIYNGFSSRRVKEELCRKCGYRERFNIL